MPASIRNAFVAMLIALSACGGSATPTAPTPRSPSASPSPSESAAPTVEEARSDLCSHIAYYERLTTSSGDIAAAAALNLHQLSADMQGDADTYAAAGDPEMARRVRRLAERLERVADTFEADHPDPGEAFQAFMEAMDGVVADLPDGLCDPELG